MMLEIIRFVGARFLTAAVTLLLVTFIVFALMELSPVDYSGRCLEFMRTSGYSPEQSYIGRWWKWVTNVFVHHDFGESCVLRKRINALLGDKFWLSLGLCLASLLLAYLIAIPVGIYSATVNTPALNGFLRVFSYLGLAVPNFLLALIILLVWSNLFGETFIGLQSRAYQTADWSFAKLVDFLSHAWLPVIVLGWSATAFALVSVRALVSEEIGKPYVTAARARGLSGQRLLLRYPARHALGPVLNSLGFDLNRVFNELPIVALILSLTDAGALLLQSLVRSNDQPLAAAILFLMTASIIVMNFTTDIVLLVFDPRFRRGLLGRHED